MSEPVHPIHDAVALNPALQEPSLDVMRLLLGKLAVICAQREGGELKISQSEIEASEGWTALLERHDAPEGSNEPVYVFRALRMAGDWGQRTAEENPSTAG